MNKLQTTSNGGFPILLDDLRWTDDAYREAFAGAMASYGIDTYAASFILAGCVITGSTTHTCASGWICLKGEILRVDAHVLPALVAGQIYYWAVVETNDPAGSKIFRNNSTIDTYKVRRAKIIGGTAPSDYLGTDITSPTPRLSDKIFNNLDALRKFARITQEAWHAVGSSGEPAFAGSIVNASTYGPACSFFKDEFNNVHIRGAASGISFGPTASIWTLPSAYRPTNILMFFVPVFDSVTTNWNTVLINILPTGAIITYRLMDASVAITTPVVNLGEIVFSL